MPCTFPKQRPCTQSPLSDAQWRGFFQSGFCIVKGLLLISEVAKIRDSLHKLLDQAKMLAAQQPPKFGGAVYHQGAKFVIRNNDQSQLERLDRVCGCGSADNILLNASRHRKLLSAFHDLLLSDCFEQLICQFHAKMPGDNVSFRPHRDIEFRLRTDPQWQDINHWGSYVVAVMAIDRAESENGGLYLAPGSHKHVQLKNLKPAHNHFNPEWGIHALCPTLEPGDTLFIHPYLVHWSNSNTSNHPRFSLLSGMSSLGANHMLYPGDCTNEIISSRL
ncbi:MAG: phytanoyl-CoA dioxygenase family protein [Endozoicomonas sp. (ex Botrylloides leachii)]|nr:phytanoyl-CoA dioxygenase family protein [Endozoicomonas sp. (ex Botrylloides leachii)]